jgi:cytochrome c556
MKTSTKLMLILLVLVLTAPALPGQTPATRRVMREKLTHSQRILEAILTSDFALLERETTALTRVTETAAWQALRSPEYLRQSEAFLAANRSLNEAAKTRDLDGAAQLYSSLTMSCFACHRHMKDSRLAR